MNTTAAWESISLNEAAQVARKAAQQMGRGKFMGREGEFADGSTARPASRAHGGEKANGAMRVVEPTGL